MNESATTETVVSAATTATFTALGYNAAFCSLIATCAMIAFSAAVHFGKNGQLAPRTWSRPKEVLKNVLSRPYGLSWIPWTLNLTYHEMLEGIPGTGTRNKGKQGTLLKCNLDGIIIIKFHSLMLKVAFFTSILCCVIILPLNLTAPCNITDSGAEVCKNITHMDNYAMTTIAHIPPMVFVDEAVLPNATDTRGGFRLEPFFQNLNRYFVNDSGITPRLICIVIVAWCIYTYTCYLVWNEWIENSALRRIYFLEAEHFDHRKQELEYLANLDVEYERPEMNLKQFLPHPELRETVPPVSLYSALYKLPPCDVISVDEQLKATIEFFDKCVPNQPGFSSSVAAATILPDPAHLALVWGKFYALSTQVRRLRFIRFRLKELRSERRENIHNISVQKLAELNGDQEQGTSPMKKVNSDGSISARKKKDARSNPKGLSVRTSFIDPDDPDDLFGYNNFQLDDLHMEENIESLAVFEREFSQSAACCPNGMCNDSRIRYADVDTLLEMEEETQDAVDKARRELIAARSSQKRSSTFRAAVRENFEMLELEEMDAVTPLPLPTNRRFSQAREVVSLGQDLDASIARKRRSNTDFSNRADSGSNPFEDLKPNLSGESGVSGIETVDASYPTTHRLWELANRVVLNSERPWSVGRRRYRRIADGRWKWTSFYSWWNDVALVEENPGEFERFGGVAKNAKPSTKKVINSLIEQQKYAVVTFTSRQAAVSARQCVADASGLDRWVEIDSIPVPPLADSPPNNILFCRGCCKPVTVTLNDTSKKARNNLTIMTLIFFCLLYTVPLSLTSTYFSDTAQEAWPNFPHHNLLSGFISGGLYTIFFSVCPFIFKLFANYGSNATSIRQAELGALRYYWFFILFTAFAGQSLVSMTINGYLSTSALGNQASVVVMHVAKTIPTSQSVIWMNWIIIRIGFTLPVNYLLQFNTFLFKNWPGMRCCSRLVSGGGAGGPMPYRMYVDAGLVFLCVIALAPASPLVAPIGTVYFLVSTPILRWLLIFVYRPMYDGGGMRWTFLHDMIISAMVTSQVLLLAMMLLKNAHGPALLAGLAVVPTLTFNNFAKKRFLRPYSDAGLLQTSQLDGWDYVKLSSYDSREEFRKWLVDCHKASFIPMCLAGKDNFFSYEPAVALPDDYQSPRKSPGAVLSPKASAEDLSNSVGSLSDFQSLGSSRMDALTKEQMAQKGAMFRRMSLSGRGSFVNPQTFFDGDLFVSAGESDSEIGLGPPHTISDLGLGSPHNV